MTTTTFKMDIIGLSLLTADGNGRILDVDGRRVLVAFDGGDKRWCGEEETAGWLLCDHTAYTPGEILFDGVEAFKNYCRNRKVFAHTPYLEPVARGYRDGAWNLALEWLETT